MGAIRIQAALLGLLLLLTQGCRNPDEDYESNLPAINDVNCDPKKIAEMHPKQRRDAFSLRCFTRSNYRPSPPRSW